MRSSFCAAIILVAALASRGAADDQAFEGWHLEPGLSQAHLVMVARVASIGRLTVVEGAKTEVALREYRFQPVRRLKGIFQRDELSMTASDLGCPADDGFVAPPLKEGEFRLLILAQQQGRMLGCVSAAPGAATFDERVPRVTGPDDPLVAVVETLIRVADSRSRRERADLIIERLADVDGLAAVPLLSSLRLRADWAAADGRAFDALARLAQHQLTAVRGAALDVIRDMLASRTAARMAGNDRPRLDGLADALRKCLESDEPVTRLRLAALESLGHLLASGENPAQPWPRELLSRQLTTAATGAERTAAAKALANVAHPQAVAAVLDALAALPLDEPPAREAVYGQAAVRLDAAKTERILLARLERSIAARQSVEAEVGWLGRMRSRECLPLLLAAADQTSLPSADRYRIAWALGRLGDDRAVPVLVGWLRGMDYQLKEFALTALESVDSPAAAREARPLVKSEAHLPYKLRLARLLARHQLADGYALATEHLADDGETGQAALVLAALDDPRTAGDLHAIIAARPDRRWHAAALSGLAAIDDPAARRQLLDILADDRHPLAADAAAAVGLSADAELLLPLATLVRSRNRQIAMSSLVALRRFLSGVRSSPLGLAAVNVADRDPNEIGLEDKSQPGAELPAATRAALAESVASLALDAYVEPDVRHEALAVARLLGGEGYAHLLSDLADQAELEGTPLLAALHAERR
jgi:HEAT repeat protein